MHSTFIYLFAIASLLTIAKISPIKSQHHLPNLDTVKQWNLLTYDFPWNWPVNDKELNNPEQIVATGFEVSYNRIFIATPRLFSGVPATLSSIPRGSIGDSPVLQAYPDWSHHTSGTREYNCTDIGLISVYRLRIDSCNRLWALDAGVSRSLEDFEVTCPPKILVYDLTTNKVVRRIDFPEEVVTRDTLFTNLIIDETTSRPENYCDDVFVYITDTVSPGLVVYDSGRDLTWRLSHPSMYPDPNFAESTILEHKFTLMDGVVGLSFDPESATVYFQPLATDRLFSIASSVLRAGPLPFGQELPVKLVGRKSSQGLGLGAASKGGTIYFSPFSDTAIVSYNPYTRDQMILAKDSEKLQFAADIRTPERDPRALYILTSKFHRFFLKNLDTSEFNTRLLRIDGVVSNIPNTPVHKFTLNNVYQPPIFSNYPVSSAIPPTATAVVPFSYGNQQQNKLKSFSYLNKVLTKHPYPYETVGIINKAINNPFLSLNQHERPQPQLHDRVQYSLNGEFYPAKVKFNDFNGLRFRKSSSFAFNSSIVH